MFFSSIWSVSLKHIMSKDCMYSSNILRFNLATKLHTFRPRMSGYHNVTCCQPIVNISDILPLKQIRIKQNQDPFKYSFFEICNSPYADRNSYPYLYIHHLHFNHQTILHGVKNYIDPIHSLPLFTSHVHTCLSGHVALSLAYHRPQALNTTHVLCTVGRIAN